MNETNCTKNCFQIGKETAWAMSRLLKQGVPVEGVHFVGHSLGAHVLAYAARSLAAIGFKIPRYVLCFVRLNARAVWFGDLGKTVTTNLQLICCYSFPKITELFSSKCAINFLNIKLSNHKT